MLSPGTPLAGEVSFRWSVPWPIYLDALVEERIPAIDSVDLSPANTVRKAHGNIKTLAGLEH